MRITTLALDLAVVLLFAIAGQASHYDAVTVSGVLGIAWPFAIGLVLAWLVAGRTRWSLRSLRTGVLIWPLTLVAGMAIRLLTGQGTVLAFVLVATGVLGLGLLGWRTAAALITRWPVRPGRPAGAGRRTSEATALRTSNVRGETPPSTSDPLTPGPGTDSAHPQSDPTGGRS